MAMNTEIVFHPILPRLKQGSGNKISNFTDHGQWHEREFSELNKLSDSLKVEQVATQVNSIPDVWARPLLFEMALYDTDHLLHKRTVAEWRGLLAVLAFKEVAGLNIRIVEAVPNTIKKEEWPSFLSVLEKVAPKSSISEKDTWWFEPQRGFYPYVILNNDKPIGLLSPTTLVCTATNCFNRLDGIRWSDGRYLKDPSGKVKESDVEKINQLNSKEQNLLAAWLEILKNSLKKLSIPNNPDPRMNKLLTLLSEYIDDLGGSNGLTVTLSDTSYGTLKGFFTIVSKPIRGDQESIAESHLQLVPSEGKNPKVRLFIVDKSIAQQWNMNESDVVIYRGATLADIPFGGLGRERKRIREVQLQTSDELCPLEDIFTEKLYLVYQANAFPGTVGGHGSQSLRMQNQVVTPILPLTRKLLYYLDNDELSTNLTFEQSSESIHVRLKVRLSGVDGSPRHAELKKEYKKEQIEILDSVPVLEVWPNFRKKNWQLYYTYYSKTGQNTFYAKPFCDNSEVTSNKKITMDSEVTFTQNFPPAMLCYKFTQGKKPIDWGDDYIGLLLLNIPKSEVSSSNDIWRIGIDFGTTSTSVYIAPSDSIGEPLVFRKELILQVTASGSDRSKLYDEFIPGESERIPFLTLFQEFGTQRVSEPINIFTDGHIYFINKSQALTEIPSNVSKNLKWSDEKVDRERATAFLEQVCCQALAEIASRGGTKVSWRYSYPTAFSEILSSGLPQKWHLITEKYHRLTGIERMCAQGNDNGIYSKCTEENVCKSPDHAAYRFSESHATAIYFAEHLKASTRYGTVCIDIGGGTSDIAIWQEDKLCYQVSLRLAGREILLNALRAKPEFLKHFGVNTKLLQDLRIKPVDFNAQADALISREGDEWLKKLPDILGLEETKKLIQIISIGLSGLFYYVGIVLESLIRDKKYKSEPPDIYIGGNGSKLFHWITSGAYDLKHPINELFRAMLSNTCNLDWSRMKIVLSPNPKCETAQGLIGTKLLDVVDNYTEKVSVISGERIIIENRVHDHDTILTAAEFRRNINLPKQLDMTEAFTKVFDKFAHSKFSTIPPINYDLISLDHRKRLGGVLADIAKKNENEISVEPIFILSVKTLLEVCTEQWSNQK